MWKVKYQGEIVEVLPYKVNSYNDLLGINIIGFNRADNHNFISEKNCRIILQDSILNASKEDVLNNIDGLTDSECRELLRLYLGGELN